MNISLNTKMIYSFLFCIISEVQATMHTSIYIIVMLVTLQSFVKVAGANTTTESTIPTTTSALQITDSTIQSHLDSNLINSSSKKLDESETIPPMDRDTQNKVEKNLLTIFGMSKRPKPIDRSKVVIPEAMKQLYAELMGDELRESVNLPTPGVHTKSANTVRSFTHEGMSNFNTQTPRYHKKIIIIIKYISCKHLHIVR